MKKHIRIFHITHLENLPSIIAENKLWSEAKRMEREIPTTSIGHEHIKRRRLQRPVSVAAGGMLGDYVPFNFCPRSVMLYAIYAGNVAQYRGGQNPIVHLVSTVELAIRTGRPWAFTDRHAELGYARYFDSSTQFGEVEWRVMPLKYWADSDETKERRQAEFLVHEWFPWDGITHIGVKSAGSMEKVLRIVAECRAAPRVSVETSWYY